jgi:hypothetical protein
MKAPQSKICPCCGIIFYKSNNQNLFHWNKQKYCCHKCGLLKLPKEEYLEKKLKYIISKSIYNESGCLEYQGSLNKGYGLLKLFGKTVVVTRIIWTILKGDIPKGLCVLHQCDNPKCVNIDHLFLGTHQDNSDDKIKKGRNKANSKYYRNKIDQILELINKGVLYKDIAIQFSLYPTRISQIAIENGIIKNRRRIKL